MALTAGPLAALLAQLPPDTPVEVWPVDPVEPERFLAGQVIEVADWVRKQWPNREETGPEFVLICEPKETRS